MASEAMGFNYSQTAGESEYDLATHRYRRPRPKIERPPPKRPRITAWHCETCGNSWTGTGRYRLAKLHSAMTGHKVKRDGSH